VILGISSLPLAAFAGGLGVILLVVAIHGRGHGSPVESLLLTGLAVGSILSAAASLVMVTSQEPLQAILFWLLGSLSSARWLHVASVLPFFLVAGTAAWLLARDLDVLVWGDDTSRALGISVRRVRVLVLVIATLLASAAVAVSGIIGFLGLMTPHIARFLVGASHRRLIPMSLILGASLLLAADMGARTLWAPVELPIGAVTALVGAPFLAYLANRRG
jgi:iron complex transport system permease protein